MKVIDKTPYRSEDGEITLSDRIQASLKFGLSWYGRVLVQEKAIAALGKLLNNSYTALCSNTLPGTDITLPLILIGPAGVFLINTVTERGIYRAKGSDWGTISGDRFVPARVNRVTLTIQMARVLQRYLDREGFSGQVTVEPILMAPDPSLNIDSVRPDVRIVMSDALDRFAASLLKNQAGLPGDMVAKLVRVISEGVPHPTPQAVPQSSPAATPAQPDGSTGASQLQDSDTPPTAVAPSGSVEPAPAGTPPLETPAPSKPPAKLPFTTRQFAILGSILLCWVCIMVAFIVYIIANLK